jgi:hypothetical protein
MEHPPPPPPEDGAGVGAGVGVGVGVGGKVVADASLEYEEFPSINADPGGLGRELNALTR